MIRYVNFDEFYEGIRDSFSLTAAEAIWEYFEQVEAIEQDINIEYDPVAIRCEYNEYNLEDFTKDYDFLDEDQKELDFSERFQLAVKFLENRTTLLYQDEDEDILVFSVY